MGIKLETFTCILLKCQGKINRLVSEEQVISVLPDSIDLIIPDIILKHRLSELRIK